jgi:LytS/YehU family sensor histidine kinase
VYGILFRMPLVILATYFILYYLLPKLSTKDDRGQFFLWMLALLISLAIAIRYYKYYILGPWFDPQHIDSNIWDGRRIISEIFSSVIVISMALAIKLIKNKTKLQQRNEQLIHEKKESELSFLKAQMHPHFLFNTLNTLYSETIQESGKAQSIVLHLSSLLRFILEECDRPYISLEHEIKVIRDFIALEQLRHGERLSVDFVVSDVPQELEISPLIFLPFVENSFKHTLNHKRGRVSIRIEIVVVEQQCRLLVWNEREAAPKHVNGRIHGRGLANIKRQLELLYGKDYTLVIDDTKNKYEVSLTVPLKQSA